MIFVNICRYYFDDGSIAAENIVLTEKTYTKSNFTGYGYFQVVHLGATYIFQYNKTGADLKGTIGEYFGKLITRIARKYQVLLLLQLFRMRMGPK